VFPPRLIATKPSLPSISSNHEEAAMNRSLFVGRVTAQVIMVAVAALSVSAQGLPESTRRIKREPLPIEQRLLSDETHLIVEELSPPHGIVPVRGKSWLMTLSSGTTRKVSDFRTHCFTGAGEPERSEAERRHRRRISVSSEVAVTGSSPCLCVSVVRDPNRSRYAA
jgi:hypothetical protein